MRPLKFRAYMTDKDEFIYFDLNDPDEHLFGRHGLLENEAFEPWQQFTGLLDKDGVEVFEGDIVEVKFAHGTKRSDVRFFADFGVFALSEVPNYYVTTPFDRPMGSSGSSTSYKPYTWKTYRSIEVIGNIHQNSDLLTKVKGG